MSDGTAYTLGQYNEVLTGVIKSLPKALDGTDPKEIIRAISRSGDQLLKALHAALLELSPVMLQKINRATIGATDSSKTIINATDVFRSGIYGFEKSERAQATDKTPADIYKLVENGTYLQMLSSVSPIVGADGSLDETATRKLCHTQHQIIQFCVEHPNLLSQTGATFFLFEEDGEFFVARVFVYSDGLSVHRRRLDGSYEWRAEYDHRFVLPQLA